MNFNYIGDYEYLWPLVDEYRSYKKGEPYNEEKYKEIFEKLEEEFDRILMFSEKFI